MEKISVVRSLSGEKINLNLDNELEYLTHGLSRSTIVPLRSEEAQFPNYLHHERFAESSPEYCQFNQSSRT